MSLNIPPLLHNDVSAADKRALLRRLLAIGDPVVLPGVYDALTAVLAQNAGFPALYLTGAGLTNSQLGAPDVGLLSFDLVATQVMRICAATTAPVLVDIDTGFGGPSSVMHSIRTLETLGAAGAQIEDQAMPKRCGHFTGKSVIEPAEMQAKIDAAVRARSDDGFLVIARTDAVAVNGLEDALRRARAYREAGADVLFVEAPNTRSEVERIPAELHDVPLLLNVVPGGRTPDFTVDELAAMGYRLVLHANLALRTVMKSVSDVLGYLRATGESQSLEDKFVAWDERQRLVRLNDFDAVEDALTQRWELSQDEVRTSG